MWRVAKVENRQGGAKTLREEYRKVEDNQGVGQTKGQRY